MQATQIQFQEQFLTPSGAKVGTDREGGKLLGVKLIGFQSKNTPAALGLRPGDHAGLDYDRPYCYSREAVEAITYKGLPVYMNHQRPDDRGTIRNVQEQVGYVESDYMRADGRYGDVCLFREGVNEGTMLSICERAERAPQNLGFSQVALGGVDVGPDGQLIVCDIVCPESVDLVTKPSTTSGLFESVQKETKKMFKKIKDVLSGSSHKTPYYKVLREMVDAGEVSPEAEVEAPPEKSDSDVIKEAVLNKIKDKLASDPEKLKQVLELLEIDPMGEAVDGDGGSDEAPAAAEESAKVKDDPRLKKLEEMVARQHAENILLREGITADDWKLTALMNVNPEVSARLVESWRGSMQPASSPPKTPGTSGGSPADTLKRFQEAAGK